MSKEVKRHDGKEYAIVAEGQTYDAKEHLKKYGWVWNGKHKLWVYYSDVNDDDTLRVMERRIRIEGFEVELRRVLKVWLQEES